MDGSVVQEARYLVDLGVSGSARKRSLRYPLAALSTGNTEMFAGSNYFSVGYF